MQKFHDAVFGEDAVALPQHYLVGISLAIPRKLPVKCKKRSRRVLDSASHFFYDYSNTSFITFKTALFSLVPLLVRAYRVRYVALNEQMESLQVVATFPCLNYVRTYKLFHSASLFLSTTSAHPTGTQPQYLDLRVSSDLRCDALSPVQPCQPRSSFEQYLKISPSMEFGCQ